jgi:Methane oxygenase PmoA
LHKLIAIGTLTIGTMAAPAQVKVVADEAQKRVDVTIDGKPFTAYVWPDSLMKPVLDPLVAPDGTTVTRGYPLFPGNGERVDHPHHAGLWFNYGNLDNVDYWNNSTAIPEQDRAKFGTIHHNKIVLTKSGTNSGELVVDSTWTNGQGKNVITQRTRYVFSRTKEGRSIDVLLTLHALDKLVFHDDKEGMLGIRVASFLESANEKGGIFTDASGKATKVDGASSSGANGVYLTSEGVKGEKVWSTRGKWCSLTGKTADGKTETIAILDNPTNPNYPTYWHARGYGLFAANPLGQHIFDPDAPQLDYTVQAGKEVKFRYRVELISHATTANELNKSQATFAAEYH